MTGHSSSHEPTAALGAADAASTGSPPTDVPLPPHDVQQLLSRYHGP